MHNVLVQIWGTSEFRTQGIPFLADHYQRIYVVDYRYWDGNIVELAKEKSVDDVIFINNISMTRNSYLVGKMDLMVQ